MPNQSVDLSAPVLREEGLQAYNNLVSILYRCLHDSGGFAPFSVAFREHFKALQGGILGVSQAPQRLIYGWTFGCPEGG